MAHVGLIQEEGSKALAESPATDAVEYDPALT
jgi:hypothetical protein